MKFLLLKSHVTSQVAECGWLARVDGVQLRVQSMT